MDEAGKVRRSPVTTGGKATEVFKRAEATFDPVTLLVDFGVVRDNRFAGYVLMGSRQCLGPHFLEQI